MRVVFRADSSLALGTGHATRCLTLADELRRRGAETLFLCCGASGAEALPPWGGVHRVLELPQRVAGDWAADAEESLAALRAEDGRVAWLVVDHYGLDARWERALRGAARWVMVIDDLADRPHDCDLLLDQNLRPGRELPYRSLVPPGCSLLLGPAHALLRPEFLAAAAVPRARDGTVRRVLVAAGGTDPSGLTLTVLEALARAAGPGLMADVVVGAANPAQARIAALCASLPGASLHVQPRDLAALMALADLAISAGGTTTWELCCLGVPAILVAAAANQAGTVRAVAARGAAVALGLEGADTADAVAAAVTALRADPRKVRAMGEAARAIGAPGLSGGAAAEIAAIMEAGDVAA